MMLNSQSLVRGSAFKPRGRLAGPAVTTRPGTSKATPFGSPRGATLRRHTVCTEVQLEVLTKEIEIDDDGIPIAALADLQHQMDKLRPALDFADLVDMSADEVYARSDDATMHRLLTGAKAPTLSSRFNLKATVGWRNNVTRALAPTVARAFARAACGAEEGDDCYEVYPLPPDHVMVPMQQQYYIEQQQQQQQQQQVEARKASAVGGAGAAGGWESRRLRGSRGAGRASLEGAGRRGESASKAAWI